MDYLHRYMLMQLSKSLTDKERDFLVGQAEEKNLRAINTRLDRIEKQGSFGRDFASNIAGNAVFDGAVWIVSKLLKRLR